MPTLDDEVVVLRSQLLGEADRIVTVFGREHGKTRAIARGTRRTSSKFGARLEPFNVLDVQLFTRAGGRAGLDTITQAVTVHPFSSKLRDDFARYSIASAITEAADRILESEPAPMQYALLVGALRDCSQGTHPLPQLLDSYLLRALALAGWEPTFNHCARCGKPGPHEFISLAAGGAICHDCAAGVGAVMRVDVDSMRLLWALLAGNWRVVDDSSEDARHAASRVVAAYSTFHLERNLQSLAVLGQDPHQR